MSSRNEIEIVRHLNMSHLEIFVVEMTSRAPHGHDDLEIGLLLEGSLQLSLEHRTCSLQKGDIYIINRFQIHSFQCADHAAKILAFQIRPDFYTTINPALYFLKFEDSLIQQEPLKHTLSDLLLSSANAYFQDTLEGQLLCSSLLLSALVQLMKENNYSISSEQESTTEKQNTLRLNRIMQYISEHHQERLSLAELASQECITVCHMSHFISSMLGITFQQYLNQVRFEHALHLIRHTDLSATDICLTAGFSSTRYLNQMFEHYFHCTYKEYIKAKEKPRMDCAALPAGNRQNRFSFSQSKFMLEKITGSFYVQQYKEVQ